LAVDVDVDFYHRRMTKTIMVQRLFEIQGSRKALAGVAYQQQRGKTKVTTGTTTRAKFPTPFLPSSQSHLIHSSFRFGVITES